MHFTSRFLQTRDARRGLIRPGRSNRGFTLLEILVVLAIIGLLATIAINNIGGFFGGAQVSTTQMFVGQTMKTALTAYRIQVGTYPSTSEGLQALIERPASNPAGWHGPYVDVSRIPNDPWGEQYQYAYPGKHNKNSYDIWSKGPDRQDGTADDIGNWELPTGEAPK